MDYHVFADQDIHYKIMLAPL
jgi:hypothetical protein